MNEVSKEYKFHQKGKYQVSSHIFLDLIFNNKCNYRCPFCIARTKSYSDENLEKWKDSLKRTLNIFSNEIDSIIILGGESTIDPYFFTKLDYIKELVKDKNILIILTTNGKMLANDSFLDKVTKSCIDSVNISVMNHDNIKNNILMGANTLTRDEIEKIYNKLHACNKTLRLNTNVSKVNLNTIEEIEDYIKTYAGICDTIKFTPLMVTDMFDTEESVLEYTKENAMPKNQIKDLFDSLANKYNSDTHNSKVFGLINYGELVIYNQHVILKYEQVEDMYDLDKVIPTLKLYPNGNLSNEWNYRKNILEDFN